MLWYGYRHINSKKNVYKLKKKNNLLTKTYCYPITSNIQLNKQTFRLHKPFNWDLVVIKNKIKSQTTFYLSSNLYKIKLPLPTKILNFSFDKNTNIIKIHTLYINNNYRLYWHFLQQLVKAFYSPFFLKLKFKGKGYYIYKNKRNTITPQFGYAHRLYLYSYFVSVKFLSKTSIIVFGFKIQDLIQIGLGIKSMRPINVFTGRGVRFSRQIIYKKVGKVSSYR
jgi:ribosomal protein L6P/L9E